jgi:hypothetical protein
MLAFSDILKGRDPTPGVLQRQSAMEEDIRKRQQKQQQERTAKSAAAYLKSIGATEEQIQLIKDQPELASQVILKSFDQKPKERKMLKGAEGYYRYVDTGERVFPGVVKPEKEKSPSQLISKQELDVLNKIKSLQDQVDAGTLILKEDEQITDKLNQYEKLILQSYISRPQQQDSFAAFAQYMNQQNDDDLIIKKVE